MFSSLYRDVWVLANNPIAAPATVNIVRFTDSNIEFFDNNILFSIIVI